MAGKPKKRHPVVQPLDKPFRFIPLTQGQNAIVDAEDFERLSQKNWCAWRVNASRSFYAIHQGSRKEKPRKTEYMHRVILDCGPGEEGDHKNHDTLDNRRKNLRKCTHIQNMGNFCKPCTNTSGYKGVSWQKRARKWSAQIRINGGKAHLGLFTNLEEAARAYDEAAKKHYGEFSHLNFPIT